MQTTQVKPLPKDFSYLDAHELQDRYADTSQSKIQFYVGGIRCEKCVRKLEGLVGSVPGLIGLRVEMGKNIVHAEVDRNVSPFSVVAREIERAGFDPIPLGSESEFVAAQEKEDRDELIRLAVGGACAGNIMTFAFAVYFGANPPPFLWLSFLLYIPVVTYVAWPFYVGAWRAIKAKTISIDLPMSVASLAGFAFSFVALLRGRTDVYFDSISGFLFLILVSRWVQKRLQRRYLRPEQLIESLRMERVRILKGPAWSWHPIEHANPGDAIVLFSGDTVPVDGDLGAASAQFSLAWLTGESRAKTLLKGARVHAGSRLLSGEAHVVVAKPLGETAFGKLLNDVNKFALSTNPTILASDRLAQWLLAVVFGAALIFLAIYWQVSPEAAIARALALIVLACPCAMAFGTPLALAASLKRARKAGLVVRDAGVLGPASEVQTIFFDKTGTLTETDLTLVGGTANVSALHRGVVLGLENISYHPIAFAFRKAFSGDSPTLMEDVTEIPGVGVRGRFQGDLFELRAGDGAGLSCALFVNGREAQQFKFQASIKADCMETLSELRKRGYHTVLLSGDREESVRPLAEALGFTAADTKWGLTPSEKAMIVAQNPGSMMVGDGINDSPALMMAAVGVAVSGGVESALKSAGVFLAEPGIKGLLELMRSASEARQLIRQNIGISLVYNGVGGVLALSGFINPFVAAVLMPISSGFILLSTWARSRR